MIQKNIAQWMLKITAYADKLLEGLDTLEWPEKVKTMQRNWIGKSEGVEILLKHTVNGGKTLDLAHLYHISRNNLWVHFWLLPQIIRSLMIWYLPKIKKQSRISRYGNDDSYDGQ